MISKFKVPLRFEIDLCLNKILESIECSCHPGKIWYALENKGRYDKYALKQSYFTLCAYILRTYDEVMVTPMVN